MRIAVATSESVFLIPHFAKIEVPVRMWDERQTTVSAAGFLNETDTRGKKRKAVIDAVAAVIILDSYLQWRKNHPGEF